MSEITSNWTRAAGRVVKVTGTTPGLASGITYDVLVDSESYKGVIEGLTNAFRANWPANAQVTAAAVDDPVDICFRVDSSVFRAFFTTEVPLSEVCDG